MTKGTGGTIIHKPNVFGERGDLLGGYYFAVLTSGVVKFDAMPKARIEEIKSRSEAVKKGKQSKNNRELGFQIPAQNRHFRFHD